ncbi:MAG: hypothetical protein RJB38_370 [Pseudomonadota bacterium]|jgi:cyclopropane-fatty-acyl-phospholipid synthase
MSLQDFLLHNDLVPDGLIRMRIRALLRDRLHEISKNTDSEFATILKRSPLAVHTADANEQHYEVPTAFYLRALGPRLKYSCAWYETGTESLEDAEVAMLEKTCERAELAGLPAGSKVLELGCGWGSLTLHMAVRFPHLEFTGVSNSRTQKAFIDAQCAQRQIQNVRIITADMNQFIPPEAGSYARVVSVEMFEHMRNYELLLKRIASWLTRDGKLFVHIFTHRKNPYLFEVRDDSDWMSRYFFTGGQMPSDRLFYQFQDDLIIKNHWTVNGRHYSQTSEHWLQNMDSNREEILALFQATYGRGNETRWWVYWRVFFMACAELWGFRDEHGKLGEEWLVSHYLFEKPR